jgi:hypothetical protein
MPRPGAAVAGADCQNTVPVAAKNTVASNASSLWPGDRVTGDPA